MENTNELFSQSGIVITLVLLLIPIIVACFIVINRAKLMLKKLHFKHEMKRFSEKIKMMNPDEVKALERRIQELSFELSDDELGSSREARDEKGIVDNVNQSSFIRFVDIKKKSQAPHEYNPEAVKLIIWYISTATFWLVFGTSVGEYLGIKFTAPDIDHISWLSFGRLRPVHTNAVFWGWCSLAMLGLAYYVVPKVSNNQINSLRLGYATLLLVNGAIVLGSILLMAGINNSGGEYREYIWPVMVIFGTGIILSLYNFYRTVANRKTHEIYVSNWYIISAMMFLLVITLVAYIPNWQNGLGETIIQGYYMHQGVGMWFMLFNLGLMYYFLPQQLNKPIYSYSLGILAFWSQILFYTLIGTHHFIFSSIPWWLQTVAIVGSVGMVIPVVSGTTNFLLTFKGSWKKLTHSYTLPFYLIGIIFYFTGSLQGTAEAFRYTNLLWHFTDFTVAHSHLTMYGIITFMLWAFIYTILPRLTGNEPPQSIVGAHFWLAFLGLLFYTFPLMLGSTLKGLMWMESKPFIESVAFMAPYWIWRAIGGSLMWISHLLFAYNVYRMTKTELQFETPTHPVEILKVFNENQTEAIH